MVYGGENETERLNGTPAWGTKPRISGPFKKRSGVTPLKSSRVNTLGGAKSGRISRRSLNEGKRKPASLGDGGPQFYPKSQTLSTEAGLPRENW